MTHQIVLVSFVLIAPARDALGRANPRRTWPALLSIRIPGNNSDF